MKLALAIGYGVIALAFGALGYLVVDTRSDAGGTAAVVVDQGRGLTRTLCAQADVISSAFRVPADGESAEHFADRMRAQKAVLVASLGLDCGTPGLGARRHEALAEIRQILHDQDHQRTGGDDAATPDQPTADDRAGGSGVPADSGPGGSGDGGSDLPPATPDPPAAGGGGGEDPDDPGSGGGGGTPTEAPDDPAPPTLGETIDDLTTGVCETTGSLGVQVPAVCS